MMKLGAIVMPCRVCNVAPGSACLWSRAATHPRKRDGFHAIRAADAEAASLLLDDGATVPATLE